MAIEPVMLDVPREHFEAALAMARQQGLTPAQVDALTYRQTAALADVVVDRDGNTPASFHYRQIRSRVANELCDEVNETRRTNAVATIQAAVRAAGARYAEATVEMNNEDEYTVRLAGAELDRRAGNGVH